MGLSFGQGLSEVHVVANISDNTVTRIAKGLYKLQMKLPKSYIDSFVSYKHHIKFIFYHRKKDITPYMVCQFGHGYKTSQPELYEIVVRKLDINDRNMCEPVGKYWQNYLLPAKFALQNYCTNGFSDGTALFMLHAKRIKELLTEISVVHRNKVKGPTYIYCEEAIEELEKLYAENISQFVKAARFKGLTRIYIGNSRMYIDRKLPTISGTFEGWLSSFTDLLGSRYSSCKDGLIGGSGSSQSLQYTNLQDIFPPHIYGKYYSIPMNSDNLKEIQIPKSLKNKVASHDWKQKSELPVYQLVYAEWVNDKPSKVIRMPNIPDEACKTYSKYLNLREKFFKKAGNYLYSRGYHVIESKWNNQYEVMIFSNKNYTKTCRIRLDENSDHISGPWINELSNVAFVDIHSEDLEIKKYLEELIVHDNVTYIEAMAKLLDETRYNTMSIRTMARLVGNG